MDNTKIIAYLLCAIFSALPIVMVKKYLQTYNQEWLLIAIIIYILVVYQYCYILGDKQMSSVYTYIKILSIILVIIFGYILYNEDISNKKCCGIILGVSSLYMLS